MTMFHRCSGVSNVSNGGMPVPVTPTEIFRNAVAGVLSAIASELPTAAGFGSSAAPAGPSPIPSAP
jgi:hypothetical protein